MKRRKAIQLTGAFAGLTVSATFMGGLLSGCKEEAAITGYQPAGMSSELYKVFSKIGEILLPETDTPGSKELGLSQIIDSIIAKCYEPDEKKNFQDSMEKVLSALGTDFLELDVAGQLERMTVADQENVLGMVKGLYGAAYQNTEYVGTNLMVYEPVPGEYIPCADISITNGKAYTYG